MFFQNSKFNNSNREKNRTTKNITTNSNSMFLGVSNRISMDNTDKKKKKEEKKKKIVPWAQFIKDITDDYTEFFISKRFHWQHEITTANMFLTNPINYNSISYYKHPNGERKTVLTGCDSKFTKDDLTIVLAIKNRKNRFNLFLTHYLKHCSDINFIIIEAKSENMIDSKLIDNSNNNIENKIIYKQVDIGEGFSLSKLRNFGIKECTTEFILFADVDFQFSSMFAKNIEACLNTKEFQESLIGLSVFETWYTIDEKLRRIKRGPFDAYGACYIIKNKLIEKYKFDENNCSYGKEEREVQDRLINDNITIYYPQYPHVPLYVLHYSHNQESRRY